MVVPRSCAGHKQNGEACRVEYRVRDFREELNDRLFFDHALPFSRLKGTLRKTHQCTTCGASLEIAAETTGHVEGSATTRRAPPFLVSVDGPELTCGSCGAVQLKSGTSTYSDVALGVDIAFATAGFRRNPLAFRSRSQAATSCR